MKILTDIAGINQGEEQSPLLVIDRIVSTFYRMPNEVGIKIIKRGVIRREFEIQRRLYNNGICVPQPLGIGEIELEEIVLEGIFMEYINGKMLLELSGEDNEKVLSRANLEIDKAKELGFVPGGDSDYGTNIIKSDKNGKVYLIDFGNWQLPEYFQIPQSDLSFRFISAIS